MGRIIGIGCIRNREEMNICYIINERNASIFGKSLVDASEENNYKGYIFRFSNAITVDENRNLLLDLLNKEAIDKNKY